ncbi:immunoglobulin-like domain-containing receptor 1a [Sinocyclocheilus grahami]|uniref:Immunoglobulin-like domain-containing receptor 1 n=1 Tax=Sinocyclocheilus grahami TaxID=75366 RepID=A0A672L892_SINGR|nr:PREDICTED: immunoglobulin-like domain-containing receptor 1 [Sinocyclocheilus grahami]
MRKMIVSALLLSLLTPGILSIQVTLSETEKRTTLFASVVLRCDFSTSAQLQNVVVTWRYKSFCKDPVLDYYSTAYQSALQLGRDPANDCVDSQRTIRTVVQKLGSNEAVLGSEYRDRKIYVQNKADLVIQEVMWWDNGMYFCAVEAPGDTGGDSDQEMKLIVYHWLTVLLIILGTLMLIILLCICCCQCCPQKCCCYVRCPCCPETCCCPAKLVMQHRMMKEAQKAMTPWLNGQPIYAPMSNHSSSYQMNPMLYAGSASGKGGMTPVPLPPPHMAAMPPPGVHGNGSAHGTYPVLEYLENQVRGMDVSSPLLQPQPSIQLQHLPPAPQHMPQRVPFSAGPPSMLSALDDGPVSRRAPPDSRPATILGRPSSAATVRRTCWTLGSGPDRTGPAHTPETTCWPPSAGARDQTITPLCPATAPGAQPTRRTADAEALEEEAGAIIHPATASTSRGRSRTSGRSASLIKVLAAAPV